MKLLRVIRFDQSDDHVFERPAAADEWAVSGAVAFLGITADHINGKVRQAFANGFLGIPSMGRSTFTTVAECAPREAEGLQLELARGFYEAFNAPSLNDAMAAAREEIAFAGELCAGKPVNCVFTVRRVLAGDGSIREEFREIAPPAAEPNHARIWDLADGD